jgi:hypothetical protein
MARRLAPMIRAGYLDRQECVDRLMEIAIERGRCDGTAEMLPWDRMAALEEWFERLLIRLAAPL